MKNQVNTLSKFIDTKSSNHKTFYLPYQEIIAWYIFKCFLYVLYLNHEIICHWWNILMFSFLSFWNFLQNNIAKLVGKLGFRDFFDFTMFVFSQGPTHFIIVHICFVLFQSPAVCHASRVYHAEYVIFFINPANEMVILIAWCFQETVQKFA